MICVSRSTQLEAKKNKENSFEIDLDMTFTHKVV